jgi:TetR/AcrR family transcriptional regulator
MATVEDERDEAERAASVPSTQQGEDTRERILEVATEEFAEKGLAGARVDEIARKARANKQLVYYYFGGKLGLYNEVLGHMIEESRHRVLAEAACESLAEKFRLMVGRGAEATGVRWQRLLGWEALEGGAEIVREAERRGTWQRHVTSVREAQKTGEVDDALDPELIALALVSVTIFPYVLPQVTKFVTGSLPTDPDFGTRYETFVEQLVRHLQPPE